MPIACPNCGYENHALSRVLYQDDEVVVEATCHNFDDCDVEEFEAQYRLDEKRVTQGPDARDENGGESGDE